MPTQKSTARARLSAALAQEILNNPEPGNFPIASEHQLCRRFNISRVTVRLALSDLEARGLIYRKHGKGTFAYGNATRVHKAVGVLLKSSPTEERWPIAQMMRGVQSILAPLRMTVMLINMPPKDWPANLASSLGSVIVFPQGITPDDLEVLNNRKLPYIVAGHGSLPGAHIRLGQFEAARMMTEKLLLLGHQRIALLTGYDPNLDAPKREGVYQALRTVGIDPTQVPEFSAEGLEAERRAAVQKLLSQQPRPTAVIAFDDSLASLLSFHARREQGLKIPENLSIVSFHDSPYLRYTEPSLTTVRFDFFGAGQRAAEALNRAALTGEALTDLTSEPVFCPGQTLAGPNL